MVNIKSHKTKITYGWAKLTIGWEDLSRAIQAYFEHARHLLGPNVEQTDILFPSRNGIEIIHDRASRDWLREFLLSHGFHDPKLQSFKCKIFRKAFTFISKKHPDKLLGRDQRRFFLHSKEIGENSYVAAGDQV